MTAQEMEGPGKSSIVMKLRISLAPSLIYSACLKPLHESVKILGESLVKVADS